VLSWQLVYGSTAQGEIESLERAGRPAPSYLFPPDVLQGFEPWVEAFWELSTDRALASGMVGPIPSASIDRWADRRCPDDAEMFRRCIRAMDRVYLAKATKADDAPKRALTPELFAGKR
jgi:hypothetical protein